MDSYKPMLEDYFAEDHPAFLSYFNNLGYLNKLNGNTFAARDLIEKAYLGYK